MRFSEIYKTLLKRDMFHYQGSISQNLQFLIEQSEIVRVQTDTPPRYGIPTKREDGTKYIIVKGTGIKDEIVELGK